MITVMFPSGVRVAYNDANDISRHTDRTEVCFKDSTGQMWLRATIPNGTACIIEWKSPCDVTGPPIATMKSALEFVLTQVKDEKSHRWEEKILLADLKRELTRFDARKKVWR